MVSWSFVIPDEFDERVRSHLADRGGDLAEFVRQAVDERLAFEQDESAQAEIAASIRRGLDDVAAGRSRPAQQSLAEIADEFGLKPGL